MKEDLKSIATIMGWVVIIIGVVILLLWMGYVFPDTARRIESVGSYVSEYHQQYGDQGPILYQ